MTLLRIASRLIGGLLLVLLIAVLLLAAGAWFFPESTLQFIVTEAMRAGGITDAAFEVRKVGARQTEIRTIRLGSGPDGMRIHSTRLDYEPAELLRGRLRHVRLSGLDLTLELKAGRWNVTGLPEALKTSFNCASWQ